jgi:CHASE3 domain sensor protein
MTRLQVHRFSINAGAALLVLALFGAVAFASVARLANQQEAVVVTNKAISDLDQLLAASSEAERAGTEFIMTGAADAHNAFDTAQLRVEDALDAMRLRAEDRPRERSALDTLGPLIGRRFETLNAGITARRHKGAQAALALARADTSRTTRGGILPLLQRMREEELVLLAEKTRLMAQEGKMGRAVILVGSLLAFILAAIAFSPMSAAASAARGTPPARG